MFKRFVPREEEKDKGEENVAPPTVEEKKEKVAEKVAKIGADEIKGASESSVHALLEEVRALRADLSGGFFSKTGKADKAPDAAKKPEAEKSMFDIFNF